MAGRLWLWIAVSGWSVRRAQLSSSRKLSMPGSTTAPFGSEAMVSRSRAVAGTVPVEPAAITGLAEPTVPLPAVGCFTKPFDTHRLLDAVDAQHRTLLTP